MSQLTNRYATALFELAQEKDTVDSWQEQMLVVQEVFKNKDYVVFFGHYRIAGDAKKEVLRNALRDKIDKDIMNFLLLLVDKKRIKNILGIAMSFHSLCNESKQIKEGFVYSVKPLDAVTRFQIEESIGNRMDCKVHLINRIDAELISGIKVVVEDEVIDGSLRYRMNGLKSELLKESR